MTKSLEASEVWAKGLRKGRRRDEDCQLSLRDVGRLFLSSRSLGELRMERNGCFGSKKCCAFTIRIFTNETGSHLHVLRTYLTS